MNFIIGKKNNFKSLKKKLHVAENSKPKILFIFLPIFFKGSDVLVVSLSFCMDNIQKKNTH